MGCLDALLIIGANVLTWYLTKRYYQRRAV